MVRTIRAALVTLGLMLCLLAVPALSQPLPSMGGTEAPTTATTEAPTASSTEATTEAPTTESWDVDTASDAPTTEATTEAPTTGTTEAPSVPTTEAPSSAPSTVPVVPTDDATPSTGNVWGYVPCTLEDGSAPGQVFPCYWDAAHQGNGQGDSYVLLGNDTEAQPAYPAPVVVPDQAPSEAPSCR